MRRILDPYLSMPLSTRWLDATAVFFATILAGWAVATFFSASAMDSGVPLWPLIVVIICYTIRDVTPGLNAPPTFQPLTSLKRWLALAWIASILIAGLVALTSVTAHFPAMGHYRHWAWSFISLQILPVCVLTTRQQSFSFAAKSTERNSEPGERASRPLGAE